MRKCKGTYYVLKNGQYQEKKFVGKFHQWGCNYEEFADVGVGNFSTAIVELPDGRIITPSADKIQFLDLEED